MFPAGGDFLVIFILFAFVFLFDALALGLHGGFFRVLLIPLLTLRTLLTLHPLLTLLTLLVGRSFFSLVGFSLRFDCIVDLRRSLLFRSEEHTSELQSRLHLVCRLLLE